MPKQLIIEKLVNYEGYSQTKAKTLVDAFIRVLKDALVSGRNVELEGIGTLVVARRPQKRRIERNLRNQVPSIFTVPRQAKTVKLKSRVDLSHKTK
jgi:DNA-binding protein HU-beta